MMCPASSMASGSSVPFLLLALLGSYWILTLAQDQPYPLGMIGRLVGMFVMVVSFVGLISSAVCRLGSWKSGSAPMMFHENPPTRSDEAR